MRWGIGSYTYTWAVGVQGYPEPDHPLAATDIVEKAASAGASTVQLMDNIPLTGFSDEQLGRLRSRADEAGLTIHVGTRGLDIDHLLRFLDIAVKTGAPLMRTIIPKSGAGSTMKEAKDFLKATLPAYEKAGVAISIENHDLNPAQELRELVEAVGSPMLGICLDTVNSLGIAEDHRRTLETLAPVANCFHAKDYRVSRIDHQMGFKVEGAPCGEGLLDLPGIVALFRRLGRDVDMIVELWTPYRESMENTIALESAWAEKSIAYVKKILE